MAVCRENAFSPELSHFLLIHATAWPATNDDFSSPTEGSGARHLYGNWIVASHSTAGQVVCVLQETSQMIRTWSDGLGDPPRMWSSVW